MISELIILGIVGVLVYLNLKDNEPPAPPSAGLRDSAYHWVG